MWPIRTPQTCSAIRVAANQPPEGWRIGKGRPAARLLVNQQRTAAIVVVKQVIVVVVKMSGTGSNVLQANRARPGFRRQANEQDVIGRVWI
jgi:hypothetical protein